MSTTMTADVALPRRPLSIVALAAFAAFTVWINYEVKFHPSDAASGSVRELGSVEVGRPAPAFAAEDLDGHPVALDELRGEKVVLLEFWATWCPPCRLAMPKLQKLHDDFGERGVQVLAVNESEQAEHVRAFLGDREYTVPVLLDHDLAIGDRYGVRGLPTLVVIDKAGVVQFIYVGMLPTDEKVRTLLTNLTG